MSYSEEQIKRYLEILHNYTKPKTEESKKPNAEIAKEMIVFLFTQDLKFANLVVA